MNGKMVLSCLKVTQNSFDSSKQDVFTFTTKTFKYLRQFEKMNSGKILKQKRKLFHQRKYCIDNFLI